MAIVRRLEVLLFTGEKALAMRWADIGDMLKKVTRTVCTSTTVVVSPVPLSHNPSISSAVKTPETSRWRYLNGIFL